MMYRIYIGKLPGMWPFGKPKTGTENGKQY
jgi:hypothetical protein